MVVIAAVPHKIIILLNEKEVIYYERKKRNKIEPYDKI